jgi:hypothetical protein
MKNNDINISSLRESIQDVGHKLSRYTFMFFILFLAALYGFVLYRVNTLAAADPTQDVNQVISKTPHIDKEVVTQLEDLKDNSVSVQTLFDEARSNPFQE